MLEGALDARNRGRDLVGVRRPREGDRELVAAVARDRVALAHDPLEPFAHLLQHRVASLLPEAIVDALEAVDVADDHDSAPARDIRLFHHAREGALKRLAVWESRDAV